MTKFNIAMLCILMMMDLGFIGCAKPDARKGPVINLQIFGSYKKEDTGKLVVNGETLYNKRLYNDATFNRRMIYYANGKKRLKIFFRINSKDTTFYYDVKRQNYLDLFQRIGYREFIVTQTDSGRFWHNDKDYL